MMNLGVEWYVSCGAWEIAELILSAMCLAVVSLCSFDFIAAPNQSR